MEGSGSDDDRTGPEANCAEGTEAGPREAEAEEEAGPGEDDEAAADEDEDSEAGPGKNGSAGNGVEAGDGGATGDGVEAGDGGAAGWTDPSDPPAKTRDESRTGPLDPPAEAITKPAGTESFGRHEGNGRCAEHWLLPDSAGAV